ncbi:hypothetical protein T03_12426 [Trichinella britovi]|uniref:Uncharacterized protein n=1 Tax=Trichinella britovi TaxID=45882 RepID=A0A0V0YUT7_TRIBR|nr:hypothetical protein T03_12426 [Trichinella britovi]
MPPHIHVVIFYGAAQIKATNDSSLLDILNDFSQKSNTGFGKRF